MDELIAFVGRVRDGIARNAYPNETAVRSQLVQPILERLKWPVYDAAKVCHEYSLKFKNATRRVDLALCVSAGGSPRCIIELKGPSQTEGDEQLFEYAFHAGAPIALLTNGEHWRFYHILTGGTYNERLVRTLDLRKHAPEEVAEALERYLSYPNTESGKASEYAKEDLSKRINRDKAKGLIPAAWRALIEDDQDDRLVKLLIDKTSSVSVYAPMELDVVSFLEDLRPSHGSSLENNVDISSFPPPSPPPEGKSDIHHRKMGAQGPIHYHLRGIAYEARNAKDAYVEIIKELAIQDDDFLQRLEPALRRRKNKGAARKKSDLSPAEVTRNSAVLIPGGWWLQTQLSNSHKIRDLKIACSVAGIPFGEPGGLHIDLPNA